MFIENKKSSLNGANRVYRGRCHEQYRSKKRMPYLPLGKRRSLRRQASELEKSLANDWRREHPGS